MIGKVGAGLLAVALLATVFLMPAVAPAQQVLRIGYPIWVGYGPLFLADKKGFLKDAGVTVEFIKMEDTKTRYVALAAGKVDAAVTWEPWLTKGKQAPHGQLLVDSSQTPGLIVDVLVFPKKVLTTRGAAIYKVVNAFHQGVEYVKVHPDESNVIMADAVRGWLKDPKEFAATLTGIRYYDAAMNKAFFAPGGGAYKTGQFAIDFWAKQGKVQVEGLKASDILNPGFIAK